MAVKVFLAGLVFLFPTWAAIAAADPKEVPFWLRVVGVLVWGCSFVATVGGALGTIWL